MSYLAKGPEPPVGNNSSVEIDSLQKPKTSLSDKQSDSKIEREMKLQSKSEDRLRLLFILHSFLSQNIDETELYTYNLAQELRKRDHSVQILYPEYDASRPIGGVNESTYNGLSIARMNLCPPQNIVETFMNEQAGNAFRQYLLNHEVDLVHFHHFIGISASPLQVCAQIGISAVVTLHDEWMLCEQFHYLQADGSFCKGPETVEKCVNCFAARHPGVSFQAYMSELFQIFTLRRQFLQNALNGVDTLIVPSRFLREELKIHGFLHPNILLLPLGLYSFQPLPNQPQKGLLCFTYLGNINFTKGLDVVIQAFNLLNTGNARLNIYGNIQDHHYYNQVMGMSLKSQIVKYHGPYKPEDLPEILSKTDIAIIPSRSENYPFVVRECLHAGVPVIASRVGGIPEIIHDGVDGLLFHPGDFRDLANKLQFFIQNPKKISSFRKHIQPVRSITEDAEQLEVIYREVLARKPKSK
jgi:glycosyltransferase involved in cell wall biosynthesis